MVEIYIGEVFKWGDRHILIPAIDASSFIYNGEQYKNLKRTSIFSMSPPREVLIFMETNGTKHTPIEGFDLCVLEDEVIS